MSASKLYFSVKNVHHGRCVCVGGGGGVKFSRKKSLNFTMAAHNHYKMTQSE